MPAAVLMVLSLVAMESAVPCTENLLEIAWHLQEAVELVRSGVSIEDYAKEHPAFECVDYVWEWAPGCYAAVGMSIGVPFVVTTPDLTAFAEDPDLFVVSLSPGNGEASMGSAFIYEDACCAGLKAMLDSQAAYAEGAGRNGEGEEGAFFGSGALTEWIAAELDAHGKYSAWASVPESVLCLKTGSTYWLATSAGLQAVPPAVGELMERPTDELQRHEWQRIIDELAPLLLSSVDYTVAWREDIPQITLDAEEDGWCCVDLPLEGGWRQVAWELLKGNRCLWVAETSNSTRALASFEAATVDLQATFQVLISCPAYAYSVPELQRQWEADRLALETAIRELGVPIELLDLSGLDAADAEDRARALLGTPVSQALGLFHLPDASTFEVGMGGRLSGDDIRNILLPEEEKRFLALLGCGPLLYGLNDILIEANLSSSTLTVGEDLTVPRVFEYLTSLVEHWKRAADEGKTLVPMGELLPDRDIAPMGEAPGNTLTGIPNQGGQT